MLDTFQRYLEIYKLVQREAEISGDKTLRLLDVGSNGPGFASYNHFGNVAQTNIDIIEAAQSVRERYPGVNFVQYRGDRLPFDDNYFDIVICVDVLEHVPPEKRNSFIRDVIRTSRYHIVFVFPVSTSERWEKFLSIITFRRIKFLQEHIEFGLPKEKEFIDAFSTMNSVKLIKKSGNMNIWLWIPIKLISSLINFIIKTHAERIYQAFLFYKATLSKIMNWGQCYSIAFVLEKNNPPYQRVRE